MKFKTAHAKVLSLLLTLVMVLSTAAVFAEGEENAAANEPVVTTQEDQNVEAAEEEAVESNVVLETQADAFAIEPNKVSIEVGGDPVTLRTNAPADTTVTWESSNESAATVADGVVTPGNVSAETTVTITAKAMVEGKEVTATCEVTVKPAAPAFSSNPVLTTDKKYKSGYESAHDNGYKMKFSDSGKGATKYQLLCDGNVVKGFENIKKDTEYEVLVPSGAHTYSVRASGNGQVKDSKGVSISISGVITETHSYDWYCKTKKKVKAGGVTIPKGTTLPAVGRSPKKIKKFKNPKKVQVVYNGRKVWVPYKSLKGGVKARVNVKQDYSRSLKEYMVNSKDFSKKTNEGSAIRGRDITSGDNTLIWACLYTQRAYTFKKEGGKWVLYHSDRITTGKFSHPTRSSETSGIYTVNKKKAGKVWMVQQNGKRYYFTHASYITKGISFHTGTWWASGKKRGSVVKNGKPGTYGCIRMYTDGAKYIYANTEKGRTGVIVTRFD